MPQSDAIKAFSTFRHYLVATGNYISASYPGERPTRLTRILDDQAQLPSFGRLALVSGVSVAQVRPLLNNAWQNELALNVPRVMDVEEAYRFSIQWSPVQAYYTLFSLWRAWALVNGGGDLSDHRTARRTVSALVKTRSLFPAPWGMCVEGGHALRDTQHFGFSGAQLHDVSNISTPPPSADEDWMSKVLRTTRKEFLADSEAKWKKNNKTKRGTVRKKITATGRAQVQRKLHSTTFLDFSYRLRLRSNYDDSADFVYGVLTAEDARQYFWNLLMVTDMGQLVLESVLRAQIGKAGFDTAAKDFLTDRTRSRYSLLGSRLRAMQQIDP